MTITVFAKIPWPGRHMDTDRPPHPRFGQIKGNYIVNSLDKEPLAARMGCARDSES